MQLYGRESKPMATHYAHGPWRRMPRHTGPDIAHLCTVAFVLAGGRLPFERHARQPAAAARLCTRGVVTHSHPCDPPLETRRTHARLVVG